jgi:hypothetical protein
MTSSTLAIHKVISASGVVASIVVAAVAVMFLHSMIGC